LVRKAGKKERSFFRVTLSGKEVWAKTSSGVSTFTERCEIFAFPKNPEIAMRASKAETVRYMRLLPVFTADTPIKMVRPI
jgi:hypothetical protein